MRSGRVTNRLNRCFRSRSTNPSSVTFAGVLHALRFLGVQSYNYYVKNDPRPVSTIDSVCKSLLTDMSILHNVTTRLTALLHLNATLLSNFLIFFLIVETYDNFFLI